MNKKDFIALADTLRPLLGANQDAPIPVSQRIVLKYLADFCESQNPRFDRERWLGYIAGECGPNGGKR